MKVIIAGSRSIQSLSIVRYHMKNYESDGITEVVSGGAKGVDKLGEEWAREQQIPVTVFPAEWRNLSHDDAVVKTNKYGKYDAVAGHRRNQKMAEYADSLVAIWDGKSKGTQDMVRRMESLGKTVRILYV